MRLRHPGYTKDSGHSDEIAKESDALRTAISVRGVAIGFAGVTHRATGSVPQVNYVSEIATARSHPYQATRTDLHANEIAWVFDGQSPIRGTVLDSWNAYTPANRKSCDTTWSNETSYTNPDP